jgi:AraC-like DNA-binding protein
MNIYYCGNQDLPEEYVANHNHYILYFVNSGKGTVTVRQAVHKVEEGQGFVVFPGEGTKIKSHFKDTLNVTYVAFSGYLVDRYLSRANLTVYDPVFDDISDRELRNMFDTLLHAATRFPNRYCKIMAQLYSIFGFLLDHAVQEVKTDAVSAEFYLVRTLDFIDANYNEDLSVEDIAERMGMTRKNLTEVFKKLTGFTPKDYLIYYRMCKAVELLGNPEILIDTVATSVGYHDQFYFSKQFKKNVGMTPSMCRKKIAEDPDWTFQSPIDGVREQYRISSFPEMPPDF